MKTSYLKFFLLLMAFAASAQSEEKIFFQSVNWSAEGKLLICAMRIKNNQYPADAYVYDPKTGEFTMLIKDAFFPAWSPDCSKVLYSKHEAATKTSSLIITDLKTNKSVTLVNGGQNSPGNFSPDGKRICFSSNTNRKLQLYTMNIDGTDRQKLTNDTIANYNPLWSPDGKKILYYKERGDNRDQIFIYDLASKKENPVTNGTLHNYYPAWWPDSKHISYVSTLPNPAHSNKNLITHIDVDGNNRRETELEGNYVQWSPDGKTMAFIKSKWGIESNIYLSKGDNKAAVCITCEKFK
jgi:Tol biopolymer transport system component